MPGYGKPDQRRFPFHGYQRTYGRMINPQAHVGIGIFANVVLESPLVLPRVMPQPRQSSKARSKRPCKTLRMIGRCVQMIFQGLPFLLRTPAQTVCK
jgi:hypothetical protein